MSDRKRLDESIARLEARDAPLHAESCNTDNPASPDWWGCDCKCECGKVRDTFACKIRHLSIQHGWAKSDH